MNGYLTCRVIQNESTVKFVSIIKGVREVVASNDSNLNVPRIPYLFLQKLKDNYIPVVRLIKEDGKLKLKDNTVTVQKVKHHNGQIIYAISTFQKYLRENPGYLNADEIADWVIEHL